jgi:hypothetical protein
VPWCVQKQLGAFPHSADFPDAYIYTGASYTTSRGLPARYTAAPLAVVVHPEPWTLAFSRLRVAAPAPIAIFNPVIPPGMAAPPGGWNIEASFF